ncbi:Inner membrane protein yqiK [Escherichia coli]|uniref:Inner membrane protein yqiK n=1 Tax=Escherichia coli TaxID=562 RepID=A0A2X1N875_ECOLX|nr:Inner membrane protein yqiK [Escherichia coli]
MCGVKPSVEGIATAAQTLGQRTLSPEDLRMLVEDKFVDALRATAAQMTMHELQDTRENFVQGVQKYSGRRPVEKRSGTGERFTYQL